MSGYRVILYHKHPTSARTRFLKFAYGGVCGFEPLPTLAQRVESGRDNTVIHPAAILLEAEQYLQLERGNLEYESGFQHRVEIPGAVLQLILARFTTIDPPFSSAERVGAEFIDLTQARGLPEVELELLRDVYELALGG
ncbi:MAG: hypothetical protein HQL48_05880 [Gammaproteobacteria bacterium]|nr:hypothetical protein [Gammaproteobacteria bacterium]